MATISPYGQHVMLYDMKTDISEKHNIAAEQPGTVAKLKAKLAAWEKTLGTPQWTSMRQAYEKYDNTVLEMFN